MLATRAEFLDALSLRLVLITSLLFFLASSSN